MATASPRTASAISTQPDHDTFPAPDSSAVVEAGAIATLVTVVLGAAWVTVVVAVAVTVAVCGWVAVVCVPVAVL
ncbi:MAG TPA: hypothetical protein VK501_22385 [Baekduia sp.]|uniref:hypothetical protein n=1 Tax=Baekduia sp. TaxID=2600305 RepID=UPI002B6F540C|nr:hypothetical protein [Baekduia sp.]HMJ36670.1 hypothetical protein [Baekduia sp.]